MNAEREAGVYGEGEAKDIKYLIEAESSQA